MTEERGRPHAEATGREVCAACPSLRWPTGQFDVLERPSRSARFDATSGCRTTDRGVPVCVHPHKVGLPAAAWATEKLPLPWEEPLPECASEIPGWLRRLAQCAPVEVVEAAITEACTALAGNPDIDATEAMRAALG